MANESPAEPEDLSAPPSGRPAEKAAKSADTPSKPKATRKPRAKKADAKADAASASDRDDAAADPAPAASASDDGKSAATDGDAKAKSSGRGDDDDASSKEVDDTSDAKSKEADDDADDANAEEEDDDEPAPVRTPEKRSRWRDLIGVLVCVAAVLFARASLIDHYVVPTGSMEPTVGIDDRVIVFKAAYGLRVPNTQTWLFRWGGPKRGDVVVLESPPQPAQRNESADPGGTILLKRVIGLPGDTVMVRDGKLTVNGQEMQLDPPTNGDATHYVEDLSGTKHFVSLALGGGPNWGPKQLPDGKAEIPDCTKLADDPSYKADKIPPRMYLVMGDNRGNSKDGRLFGCVKEDAILGHAVKIYWSKGLSWKDL